MSRFILLFVLLVAMSFSAGAKNIMVRTSVIDKITNRNVPAISTLYKSGPDSVFELVKKANAPFFILSDWNPDETYKLIVVGGEEEVRIEEDCIYTEVIPTGEYLDETVVFKIPAEADGEYVLPAVKLSRFRNINLGEASVTASKVMFYHKGDTLIYNADAFILPDGSMLDALLKQMPGVELRAGGEIYCNGKKIDNLLLNGRDLFNGNRQLMLENLGAYTVKDIAIYDKRSRMSELMDLNIEKAHVMDVRLKRRYAQGYLLNLEGGYGTHERYLAKLFGMWMSENVSVSAYAGANNLSDKRTPGQHDGSWTAKNSDNGVSTQRQGGLMYDAHGYADKWSMQGSVDVVHSNPVVDSKTTSQRYSTTGNSYQYRWFQSDNKDLNISTSHKLFFKLGTYVNLEMKPQFKYSSKKSSTSNVSAAFRTDVKDVSLQQVLDIYSADESLTSSLMNRLMDADTMKSHNISPAFDAKMDIKLRSGSNPSALTICGSTSYDRGHDRQFNRYALNYGSQPDTETSRLRYYKQYPDFNVKWSGGVTFTQFLAYKYIQLPLSFESSYDRKRRTRYIYESESGGDDLAGLIDYDLVPDMSYHYIQTDKIQTISFSPNHSQSFILPFNWSALLHADVKINFYSRNLMYVCGDGPTEIKRDAVLPWINAFLQVTPMKNNAFSYRLNFQCFPTAVDMLSLVDMPSVNPTVSMLGNPDLRNTVKYVIGLNSHKYELRGNRSRKEFGVNYSFIRNAVDRTCIIDPITGQMTIQPFNVNGNNGVGAYYTLFTPFGKMQQFNVSTDTRLNYNHTVGYLGDNVDNYGAEEKLKLGWQNGRHKVAAIANVKFGRYLHSDDMYDDFSAWTCNYGAEAVFTLPDNWSLSTDMLLYTRRGFADPRANTTDFVWNARLSKSILNGSLLFIVDGFDILHQLKSVTYSVNAQARTEVRSNTIPSYVLFHIQYRINKRPKAQSR